MGGIIIYLFEGRNTRNPVPSFAIFDQPSQVYFPQRVYVPEDDGEYWEQIADDDTESVKKIFSLMDEVIAETNRGFKFKVQHPVLGYWRLLKKLHRVS